MKLKYLLNHNNDMKAYIFLILIAIFMLNTNPFRGETIAPMDLLQKYEGWKNVPIDIKSIHPERSDILDSKLPHWIEAKHNLYKGELPIWNYVTAGGYPQLFMFTRSLLTPAFITFSIIPNDATAFYFSNLTNVLIGLLGMYLFLRIFFNRYASSFGAIIFMFSGFNTAWFFWPHLNTAIWAPWVLLSVYKYLENNNKRYLFFITLSMLFLNLGGFPIVAVMTYISVAILVVLFLIHQKETILKKINTLVLLVIFSTLALIISLPFIYPLLDMLSWIGGTGYRQGGTVFLLSDLRLFINPNIYDFPRVEKTLYVGIIPIIFLLISFFYWKNGKFILKYALILFLFSTTIAFSLVHPDLIRMIPTLNSNPWSRFAFLIDFSLAIIGAYVFHLLIEKIKILPWKILFIISIILLQVFDQKNLFQKFNSSVPNKSFYPQTKTISYLQEQLQPFQYVIADNGYFIAGTLGAYGINEWYSHSFHSQNEKKILNKIVDKPFKTPTAALFECSQINFNSIYIDYLNIKSILCSTSSDKEILPWNNNRKQKPSPVLPENRLIQSFNISKTTNIDSIKLLMATYGKKHASSDVELKVFKNKKQIAQAIVDKKNITDNQWVRFQFTKALHLSKGKYTISVEMLNSTNAKPLTIWSNIGEKHNKLEVNGEKTNLSFKMKLGYRKTAPKKFELINLEPNITIYENTNVRKSAYFLKSLTPTHLPKYSSITTEQISNSKIQIHYTSNKEGWIILPIRSYPGWEAKINGKEVKIVKFLGMLPAIKVDGKSEITFHYSTQSNIYLYGAFIIGFAILILFILKFKREKI